MFIFIIVLLILLILAVLYLYLILHLALKERENNIKILETRNILIKDSLRNIILEIEEMQKTKPTDRTRPISDDLVNDWIFEKDK